MNNIEAILSNFKKDYTFTSILPEDLNEYENYLINIGINKKCPYDWSFYESLFFKATEMYDELMESDGNKECQKKAYEILGLSLKYIYAWGRLSWGLIDRTSSTELLLETLNDLHCSLVLIGEKYLKQSFQIIRNYCETCVAILYFALNILDLKMWFNNDEKYRFPELKYMLHELQKQNILKPQEREYLRNKYIELNHSVHNKRNRLNMNLDKLDDQDRSTGFKDLDEWTKEINPLIKFMLILFVGLYEKNLLVPSAKK